MQVCMCARWYCLRHNGKKSNFKQLHEFKIVNGTSSFANKCKTYKCLLFCIVDAIVMCVPVFVCVCIGKSTLQHFQTKSLLHTISHNNTWHSASVNSHKHFKRTIHNNMVCMFASFFLSEFVEVFVCASEAKAPFAHHSHSHKNKKREKKHTSNSNCQP